jgi:methylmalonyl-CoA/ethylmalonyl-CoA epimerase
LTVFSVFDMLGVRYLLFSVKVAGFQMSETVNKIHHINFLVKDLDVAEQQYRALLGLGPAVREELPERSVLTARFRLGESWLVLVQPISGEGEPARYLREHGEGFFLVSFGVDNLDTAMARAQKSGGRFTAEQPRGGLNDWRIIDFDPTATFGATLQLTEEKHGSAAE